VVLAVVSVELGLVFVSVLFAGLLAEALIAASGPGGGRALGVRELGPAREIGGAP
jgi:hypothetical protein